MIRTFQFSKRNLKELIRDPLSLVFLIGLPIVLFVFLQLIMKSIGADFSQTPQFQIQNMTAGMIVFSFSFITIFLGNIIALDRESMFLLRLQSSPMKASNFVLGYTFAIIPIALLQEILIVVAACFLGLSFTIQTMLMILALLPVSLLFIGIGLVLGVSMNSKAVGGIASIGPSLTAICGGIFFPLEIITGSFSKFCFALPFANAIKAGKSILLNNFSEFIVSYAITLGYIVLIYLLAILIFKNKMRLK